MGQNRNNNYRCDDEHLNKIAQLANLHNISKTQVCIRAIDKYYDVQDIYIDALEAEHELLKGAYAELEAENDRLRDLLARWVDSYNALENKYEALQGGE